MSTGAKSHSASSGSSGKALTMAELMAKHTTTLQTLQKGQVVKGKITKLTPSEITMDVNAKTEAVVMEKDRRLLKQLLSTVKQGDTVEATVIYPESEMGYPVVSLRRFIDDVMWKKLEDMKTGGEKVDVLVTEATKGGFLVESDNGISGFLPNSHVSMNQDPQSMVGQKIKASIVELSRDNRKVVFSQKGVLSADDFKVIMDKYKAGTKVKGVVSGITSFGLFVSLSVGERDGQEQFVDGLIHISEVAWEKVEDLSERFAMGDEVEAVVIGTDKDSKRIDLSLKRLTKDPFAEIVAAFPVDKKVTGIVTDVTEQGAFFDLGEVNDVTVEGMMKKDKIPPTTTYEVGQSVKATVVSVDGKKRKVMLTPVLLEKPLMYR